MSNYEEDVAIDLNALDVEWLRQPELYRKYARKWEDAKTKLRDAKEKKKFVRSKLILKCHNNPDACLGGGLKSSDAKAEAYYRSHSEYQEVIQDILDCEEEVGILDVAKNEMFQRKTALENLVYLLGQKYFAAPKEPRDLNFVKEAKENASSNLTKKQVARRKK